LKRGVFFNPDPYVKLRVLPGSNCVKLAHHKQRLVTKQLKGTTNPAWKEQVKDILLALFWHLSIT